MISVNRDIRVCLVTTGHPSTNPRLVKEADALSGAGYRVHIVACKFLPWADKADAEYATRPWTVSYIRFGHLASNVASFRHRLRRKGAHALAPRIGSPDVLLRYGIHYVVPELAREASRNRADLYIAHNLAALPAAWTAAKRHGAKLGFDAEDYHRGEFYDGDASILRALTIKVEERYIPQADYVTAASEGIADAYATTVSIPRPTTILNVFSVSDAKHNLGEQARREEKPDGCFSLYWFSQTIGPDRGLEDILRSLPHLPSDVILTVRGRWAYGYEKEFWSLCRELSVMNRVRVLDVAPPHEMIVRASVHDIGLALELGETQNRRICLTNKLFTYILAGIPTLATDTPGQLRAGKDMREAVRFYTAGDVASATESILKLQQSRLARATARELGMKRYNWEAEQGKFLEVVASVVL